MNLGHSEKDGEFLVDPNAPSQSHSVLENGHILKSKQQQMYTESKEQALAETTALKFVERDHLQHGNCVKHRRFFNVEYKEKTIRFQCIEGTKRHILIKRIFHRFGIQYDAGSARSTKFVDKNGVEVPIGYRRKFGAKIFMIRSGDEMGSGPMGSMGDGDGVEEKEEIEMVFKLSADLSRWDRRSGSGFRVFGEMDRVCKANEVTFGGNKHFILTKGGIASARPMIYKWTLIVSKVQTERPISCSFGCSVVFSDEMVFDEEHRSKLVDLKPTVSPLRGNLDSFAVRKRRRKTDDAVDRGLLHKLEIVVDLTNKQRRGKGVYLFYTDNGWREDQKRFISFSPFSGGKLPNKWNPLHLFLAMNDEESATADQQKKCFPLNFYLKSIETVNTEQTDRQNDNFLDFDELLADDIAMDDHNEKCAETVDVDHDRDLQSTPKNTDQRTDAEQQRIEKIDRSQIEEMCVPQDIECDSEQKEEAKSKDVAKEKPDKTGQCTDQIVREMLKEMVRSKVIIQLKRKEPVISFIAKLIESNLDCKEPGCLGAQTLSEYNSSPDKLFKYIENLMKSHFNFFDPENGLRLQLIPFIMNVMLKLLQKESSFSIFQDIVKVKKSKPLQELLDRTTNAINAHFKDFPRFLLCRDAYLLTNGVTPKWTKESEESIFAVLGNVTATKEITDFKKIQQALIPQIDDLKVVNVTGDAVLLNINYAVSGTDGRVLLTRSVESGKKVMETLFTSSNRLIVGDLLPETTYSVTIKSKIPLSSVDAKFDWFGQKTEEHWTPESDPVEFTTPPLLIPMVSVKDIFIDSATICIGDMGDAERDIVGFEFQCDPCEDGHKWHEFKLSTYCFTNLKEGTKYTVRVKAKIREDLWTRPSMKMHFETLNLTTFFNLIAARSFPSSLSEFKGEGDVISFVSKFMRKSMESKGLLDKEHIQRKDKKAMIGYIREHVASLGLAAKIDNFVNFAIWINVSSLKIELLEVVRRCNDVITGSNTMQSAINQCINEALIGGIASYFDNDENHTVDSYKALYALQKHLGSKLIEGIRPLMADEQTVGIDNILNTILKEAKSEIDKIVESLNPQCTDEQMKEGAVNSRRFNISLKLQSQSIKCKVKILPDCSYPKTIEMPDSRCANFVVSNLQPLWSYTMRIEVTAHGKPILGEKNIFCTEKIFQSAGSGMVPVLTPIEDKLTFHSARFKMHFDENSKTIPVDHKRISCEVEYRESGSAATNDPEPVALSESMILGVNSLTDSREYELRVTVKISVSVNADDGQTVNIDDEQKVNADNGHMMRHSEWVQFRTKSLDQFFEDFARDHIPDSLLQYGRDLVITLMAKTIHLFVDSEQETFTKLPKKEVEGWLKKEMGPSVQFVEFLVMVLHKKRMGLDLNNDQIFEQRPRCPHSKTSFTTKQLQISLFLAEHIDSFFKNGSDSVHNKAIYKSFDDLCRSFIGLNLPSDTKTKEVISKLDGIWNERICPQIDESEIRKIDRFLTFTVRSHLKSTEIEYEVKSEDNLTVNRVDDEQTENPVMFEICDLEPLQKFNIEIVGKVDGLQRPLTVSKTFQSAKAAIKDIKVDSNGNIFGAHIEVVIDDSCQIGADHKKYEVEYGLKGHGAPISPDPFRETPIALEGLSHSTEYEIRVRARLDAKRWTSYSELKSFTTQSLSDLFLKFAAQNINAEGGKLGAKIIALYVDSKKDEFTMTRWADIWKWLDEEMKDQQLSESVRRLTKFLLTVQQRIVTEEDVEVLDSYNAKELSFELRRSKIVNHTVSKIHSFFKSPSESVHCKEVYNAFKEICDCFDAMKLPSDERRLILKKLNEIKDMLSPQIEVSRVFDHCAELKVVALLKSPDIRYVVSRQGLERKVTEPESKRDDVLLIMEDLEYETEYDVKIELEMDDDVEKLELLLRNQRKFKSAKSAIQDIKVDEDIFCVQIQLTLDNECRIATNDEEYEVEYGQKKNGASKKKVFFKVDEESKKKNGASKSNVYPQETPIVLKGLSENTDYEFRVKAKLDSKPRWTRYNKWTSFKTRSLDDLLLKFVRESIETEDDQFSAKIIRLYGESEKADFTQKSSDEIEKWLEEISNKVKVKERVQQLATISAAAHKMDPNLNTDDMVEKLTKEKVSFEQKLHEFNKFFVDRTTTFFKRSDGSVHRKDIYNEFQKIRDSISKMNLPQNADNLEHVEATHVKLCPHIKLSDVDKIDQYVILRVSMDLKSSESDKIKYSARYSVSGLECKQSFHPPDALLISDLEPLQSYSINVIAENEKQDLKLPLETPFPFKSGKAAIEKLDIEPGTVAAKVSVIVAEQHKEIAKGYEVEVEEQKAQEFPNSSFEIRNLDPSTKYRVRARAKLHFAGIGDKWSRCSDWKEFTTHSISQCSFQWDRKGSSISLDGKKIIYTQAGTWRTMLADKPLSSNDVISAKLEITTRDTASGGLYFGIGFVGKQEAAQVNLETALGHSKERPNECSLRIYGSKGNKPSFTNYNNGNSSKIEPEWNKSNWELGDRILAEYDFVNSKCIVSYNEKVVGVISDSMPKEIYIGACPDEPGTWEATKYEVVYKK